MKMHAALQTVLLPAYGPCPGFAGACRGMRWDPTKGHVPRGFHGGYGALNEIELVLVFAEPGDPHQYERHTGLQSAYAYAGKAIEEGEDLFHRNIRYVLDLCWPGMAHEQQMRKVWMTESVLCSATRECGQVKAVVYRECVTRYLLPQLGLLPQALVVALGGKARDRLRASGFKDFLSAWAVAPPGGNRREAKQSWLRIPQELDVRKKLRHA